LVFKGGAFKNWLAFRFTIATIRKVIYYTNYIITKVDEEEKKKTLEKLEKEYSEKLKTIKKNKNEQEELELKENFDKVKEEILALQLKKLFLKSNISI